MLPVPVNAPREQILEEDDKEICSAAEEVFLHARGFGEGGEKAELTMYVAASPQSIL